jgi:hypothetical protein
MAEACGIPYDVLRWTQEWYVREETLREANTVIVNHHHGLDLAKVFGGGTMSSSDGQRFSVRGKSTTARDMTIHGGQVLSSYTHVSDQHSTFGTKIIVPNALEAHFVPDDFLGNAHGDGQALSARRPAGPATAGGPRAGYPTGRSPNPPRGGACGPELSSCCRVTGRVLLWCVA